MKKNLGALMVQIKSKQNTSNDFIASLEEKYGVGKKSKAPKK